MSTDKTLLGIGLVFILACVFLFLAGAFLPRGLAFLEAVICPGGMQLSNRVGPQVDDEGNNVDSVTMVCVGAGRSPVDATPRMLLILSGLAIVGGAFVAWSMGGVKRVS